MDLDRFEEDWGDYGEQEARGGGGGKKPHKGPTKSQETMSQEEKARLARERQEYAESQITAYIVETWRSNTDAERDKYIPIYVKFMEKASRQKNITIDREDVKIKVKKSSGAGGQNVQKNATAADLTHNPTQLKASSQDERSQEQNINKALVELTLRVENHIKLWKETSPEFRRKLLKTQETETPREGSFRALPEGVSISEMRSQMPPNSEMIIKFNWEGDTDNKPKIAYVGDNEKYAIYPNIEYRININPTYDGEVYMNPVNTNGPAPEISDIPVRLDKYLTSKKGRKDSGMVVSIKKSEVNTDDVIKKVQHLNEISDAYNKLKSFTTEYGQTELAKTIEQIEDLLDMTKLDKGPRANDIIFREAWLMMENAYIGQVREENVEPDLKTLAENSLLSFMQELKNIIDSEPARLKSLSTSKEDVVIHLGNIPIDPNEPEGGLFVLTTYIPDRGWSVMVPIGDCPNLAANMLEKFGQGRLDEAENQTFYNSTRQAVEDGSLRFLDDGKTIVFNKLSTLDPYMAVFHGGNNTLKQAMETLRVAGDPILGERTFKFIIYKDQSELVIEQMPPITLNFD